MGKRPFSLYLRLKADYILTAAWANVTGLVSPPFEKDGFYDISAQSQFVTAAATDNCFVRLAIDGEPIEGTEVGMNGIAGASERTSFKIGAKGIQVLEGEVVSLQAEYTVAGGKIEYVLGTREGHLQIIERN